MSAIGTVAGLLHRSRRQREDTRPRLRAGQDRLCYLHLPKAAGVYLKRYLASQYGEEARVEVSIETVPGYETLDLGEYRFVAGHITYPYAARWFPDHAILFTLRHPVTRIVSAYDYWRSVSWAATEERGPTFAPWYAKRLTFAEFVRTEEPLLLPTLFNTHATYLGVQTDRRYPPDRLRRDDPRYLAIRERLRGFAWFGIQELMPQSLWLLDRALGPLPPPPAERENSSYLATPDPEPDREVVEPTWPGADEIGIILARNQVDLQIYEDAVQILQARIQRAIRQSRSATG